MSAWLKKPQLGAIFGVLTALSLAGALLFSAPLRAGQAQPLAADPVAEKRLLQLAEELRCLVCQNQNIADSNAELAQDLRREIRTMIAAGRSDREIIDFMVARYGDFVLYRPPVKASTVLLWAGPVLLLLVGLIALFAQLRRRDRRLADDAPPPAAEVARAAVLLNGRQE